MGWVLSVMGEMYVVDRPKNLDFGEAMCSSCSFLSWAFSVRSTNMDVCFASCIHLFDE